MNNSEVKTWNALSPRVRGAALAKHNKIMRLRPPDYAAEHELFCLYPGLAQIVNRPHPGDKSYWNAAQVKAWRITNRPRKVKPLDPSKVTTVGALLEILKTQDPDTEVVWESRDGKFITSAYAGFMPDLRRPGKSVMAVGSTRRSLRRAVIKMGGTNPDAVR